MPTIEFTAKLLDPAWRAAHIKPIEDLNPDWIESDEVRGGGY